MNVVRRAVKLFRLQSLDSCKVVWFLFSCVSGPGLRFKVTKTAVGLRGTRSISRTAEVLERYGEQ